MAVVSVYDLKPRFQKMLRPLAGWLARNKVTANMVTIVALLGSIIVGLLPLWSAYNRLLLLVLPLWLLVRMALNAIDGLIAREFDMVSHEGFFLNEVGDVVSDSVLYLPLANFVPDASRVIVIFCIGAILTEFCGILTKALGGDRHYEGPMGKSDRALWVGVLALATVFFPAVDAYWGVCFAVMSLLAVLTCYKRIRGGLREVKAKREGPR